jgi:hypothetical protein
MADKVRYIKNGYLYERHSKGVNQVRKATKDDMKKYGESGSILGTAKEAFGAAGDYLSGLVSERKKVLTGKAKGGYMSKSRTGHTDYRYNKGGMVMSSTNNMKKK